MTDEVKKVTIQIKPPRGTFPGRVEIGYYCVVENSVVLTDADGRPINSEKHQIGPGQDAHLLACRLVRRRGSSPHGFSDPIHYPKTGRI